MLYFRSVGEAENVFKALSTPMRVKIMEMIYEDDSLSMNCAHQDHLRQARHDEDCPPAV